MEKNTDDIFSTVGVDAEADLSNQSLMAYELGILRLWGLLKDDGVAPAPTFRNDVKIL
jgi:hypothetical protein